ncbi:hypothetical protein M8J76_012541 [Diaphorina citri]|nr:hypothetical protein M8J76_012541 [Diaphorina citri]
MAPIRSLKRKNFDPERINRHIHYYWVERREDRPNIENAVPDASWFGKIKPIVVGNGKASRRNLWITRLSLLESPQNIGPLTPGGSEKHHSDTIWYAASYAIWRDDKREELNHILMNHVHRADSS